MLMEELFLYSKVWTRKNNFISGCVVVSSTSISIMNFKGFTFGEV